MALQAQAGGWKVALGALGAYAVAAAAALAIYYWHFIPGTLQTLLQVRQDRATGKGAGGVPLVVGGSVEDASIGLFQREAHNFGQVALLGPRGFLAGGPAYYTVWPIVGANIGYSYLSARARTFAEGGTGRALVLAVAGWTVSVVLFALVGSDHKSLCSLSPLCIARYHNRGRLDAVRRLGAWAGGEMADPAGPGVFRGAGDGILAI